MDDAVVLCSHGKVTYAKLGTVLGQGLHLLTSYRVIDALLLVAGSIMVGHCHHLLGTEHADVLVPQCIKCLRCRHLMAVQSVYIQLCGTVLYLLYYVGVPDFVEEADPLCPLGISPSMGRTIRGI